MEGIQQQLFVGQVVSKYSEQQRDRMQAAVNEMTSAELSDPEAALKQVMGARGTAVPRLIREKTQFSTNDVGGQDDRAVRGHGPTSASPRPTAR